MIKNGEERSDSGLSADSKLQKGQLVSFGWIRDHKITNTLIMSDIELVGRQILHSKCDTQWEKEIKGLKFALVKDIDVVGVWESDDIKAMKPLNDRVLIKVDDDDRASDSECSNGTVVVFGPGPVDEGGRRLALPLYAGSLVTYFSGMIKNKSAEYVVVKTSDVLAVM